MSRTKFVVSIILVVCLLLQGCMYPNELRKENQASAKDGILLVQNAVDEYQKQNSLLPIVTADQSVPRYEKFKINFEVLLANEVLGTIPANAFESGGTGVYLIVNEEKKPTVRLMHLPTAQRVNDLQRAVTMYREKNAGQLPSKEQLYPGFFEISLEKIGARPVDVRSPYSGDTLTFIMDEQGNVYADYAPDIMKAVEKSGKKPADQTDDIQELLVTEGLFVPVKSPVYEWRDNAPWPKKSVGS
ncbi:hypothetical protein NQ117_04735 [Paenibacillus sp. SC116]|uniref:hypothetical protein n=1 Tax=Paenibacillus sp. SC116 TaxID=2968986 RepID=UPI00215AE623|nr:hypothetical protein [Paenibacillus sp. SC116]MCR8842978.1 hypothetical protein [Paenibacillus sp. SC116]